MKIVGYRCVSCGYKVEEYFNDSDVPPESPDKNLYPDTEFSECPECGSELKMFNFKDNPHRVNIFDRGGI